MKTQDFTERGKVNVDTDDLIAPNLRRKKCRGCKKEVIVTIDGYCPSCYAKYHPM